MRRSAAPSQAGTRPKFTAPFIQKVSSPASVPENNVLQRIFSNKSEHGANSVQKSSEITEEIFDVPAAKRQKFEAPVTTQKTSQFVPPVSVPPQKCAKFTSPLTATPASQSGNQNLEPAHTNTQCGYFSVVWCKRSNKKHKKWEGDAVLVTSSRSVTLYDIEGKEIGKSSGYKSAELSSLKEDETLPIGGKEIQVMSLLTEEQFKSGKCFLGNTATAVTTPAPNTFPTRQVSKPFSRPQMSNVDGGGSIIPKSEPTIVKPRYDPGVPGALVMPRPSESHQWQWNKRGGQVVDVVVDPYLASHLRPHQREGVTFLYECVMGFRNFAGQGAILADDMGLGKTLQCISLIWTLYKQGPYGGKPIAKKVLIVTPGSLVKNWYQEFKKWLGFERLQVFAVSSDRKVEEFMKTTLFPVLIISYEMFVRMYESLQTLTFDLIVCDEGHRLKNTNIKTSSLIMSLPTKRRVVLTGTPIQNDLQEFFSIVEFCNPGVLGSSGAFKRVYEGPIVSARQPGARQEQITLGEERGAELSRMTQMFVLRRTQEINNKYLPPKCEIVLFCRPTALQLRLYQQFLRCQLVRSCLAGSMAGSPHLICIGALKQLCNHPSLVYLKAQASKQAETECEDHDQASDVYSGLASLFPADYSADNDMEEHSGKLAVLSSLLHQLHTADHTERIVLVSNHTKTLDLLQRLCDARQYRYLRLDGQTPTSRRQELVQKFNSKHSQEFIFLLSSKAGGVGLNLIGASRLVLYDIDWNPANDLQAMARVWRDGQRKKVHIYRLLTTGSIEEKIYQRQISKQGLSGAVMDVREKNDVQFSLEDLKDLFSISVSTDCDTHDLLLCDCGAQTSRYEPQGETPVVTHRACQLGAMPKKVKVNVGMDELRDWKHLPGPAVAQYQSWYLGEAQDSISFAFYSEVKGNG